jgi:hypothetical protein
MNAFTAAPLTGIVVAHPRVRARPVTRCSWGTTVRKVQIVRVYSGDDGESHFADVDVDLEDYGASGRISPLWRGAGVQFREVDGDYSLDFHRAPRRQLVVNLTGSVELEVGDGTTRLLGPGTILLAEDTTGRGHRSRNVGGEPRTCLFVHLDD